MKIMMDIDGVLADFDQGFRQMAHIFDPSIRIISQVDQPTWDYDDIPDAIERDVWQLIRESQTFWKNLPLLPGHVEWRDFVQSSDHEIVYVSNRDTCGINVSKQTASWLWFNFGASSQLILTDDKVAAAKLIRADISLEDKAENAYRIGGVCPSYLINRPYNTAYHGLTARVKSIAEFVERVR